MVQVQNIHHFWIFIINLQKVMSVKLKSFFKRYLYNLVNLEIRGLITKENFFAVVTLDLTLLFEWNRWYDKVWEWFLMLHKMSNPTKTYAIIVHKLVKSVSDDSLAMRK